MIRRPRQFDRATWQLVLDSANDAHGTAAEDPHVQSLLDQVRSELTLAFRGRAVQTPLREAQADVARAQAACLIAEQELARVTDEATAAAREARAVGSQRGDAEAFALRTAAMRAEQRRRDAEQVLRNRQFELQVAEQRRNHLELDLLDRLVTTATNGITRANAYVDALNTARRRLGRRPIERLSDDLADQLVRSVVRPIVIGEHVPNRHQTTE